MIVVDAERCAAALPFDELIAALARQFRTGCRMPDRHVHEIGPGPDEPQAQGGTVLIMPARAEVAAVRRIVMTLPSSAASGTPDSASNNA